jgi:hypothetical protein
LKYQCTGQGGKGKIYDAGFYGQSSGLGVGCYGKKAFVHSHKVEIAQFDAALSLDGHERVFRKGRFGTEFTDLLIVVEQAYGAFGENSARRRSCRKACGRKHQNDEDGYYTQAGFIFSDMLHLFTSISETSWTGRQN